MIEKFIRWILVLPGSLASYIIVSYIFHLGTDNLSNEVGLIGYYTSLFVANIAGCIIGGAAFTITGLWISPKKYSFISVTLIVIVSLIFVFNACIVCFSIKNIFMGVCVIIWSLFGIVGAMYGADYYMTEYRNKEQEELLCRKFKEENETSKEEYDKSIREQHNKWKELIERKRKFMDRHKFTK